MPRKAKIGKDITRSIRLDEDVAEIAQRLADDKMLSHTLSKLIRQHYGLNTEIDALKAELDHVVNERMKLQENEKVLATMIDEAEERFLQEKTTELPKLQEKLDRLLEMHSKTKEEVWRLPAHLRQNKQKMIENQAKLIQETSDAIALLEEK